MPRTILAVEALVLRCDAAPATPCWLWSLPAGLLHAPLMCLSNCVVHPSCLNSELDHLQVSKKTKCASIGPCSSRQTLKPVCSLDTINPAHNHLTGLQPACCPAVCQA